MERVEDVPVPGAVLAVEDAGAGAPLVLLHGFAGDRGTWDEIWGDLARRGRVIRYDLRGFGGSVSLSEAPFRHGDDLAALLDALDIGVCDLAGVSMGGAVAMNFALDRPERVRRLALISPGMVAWDWSAEWRAAWRPILKAAQSGDMDGARDLWWRHPLFASTRAVPEAAEPLHKSILAYSGLHWMGGQDEAPAMPDVDRLWMLTTPTLLMTGGRDLPDFRLIADLIEATGTQVSRRDYPDAGHMLHLERPDRVARDLAAFLS